MVKEIKHYIDEVKKQFPFLTSFELYKIINWGLLKYAWVNRMHGDVLFKNRTKDNMTLHCGALGYDTFKHYLRWVTKWRMKERILYRLKRVKWDGYYYIGINNDLHKTLCRLKGKFKTFRDVYFTKIKTELYHNKLVTHIWRVPYLTDCGWKFFVKKYKTDLAEYIGENQYAKYHQCFHRRTDNGCSPSDNIENPTN